jgi:anti-sigma factor RsiW
MRSSDERAMKLMAYADGELEGDELAEVERWIAEDAEAVLFANDLAELGELVKVGHPKANPTIAKFDIADQLMAKLDEEKEEKPAAKVISLADRKAATPAPQPKKKSNTVAWVVAGLALAASVFFVTRAKQSDEAPLARATSALVQPTQTVAAAVSTGAVEVENPGSSVQVIYVPDEKSNVTTSVIWVDEGK